jgi:hypothetical protein
MSYGMNDLNDSVRTIIHILFRIGGRVFNNLAPFVGLLIIFVGFIYEAII